MKWIPLFIYNRALLSVCVCYLTLAKQGKALQAQAKLEPLHLYIVIYMIYIPHTIPYSNSLQFCVPKYATSLIGPLT